jgi:uncharacterized membrane protein YtjA (UPF0391 family)
MMLFFRGVNRAQIEDLLSGGKSECAPNHNPNSDDEKNYRRCFHPIHCSFGLTSGTLVAVAESHDGAVLDLSNRWGTSMLLWVQACCNEWRRLYMLHYALVFLVIALLAGAFGFFGVAGIAASFAKILFVIFLVMFLISFIGGRRRI